MNNVYAIIKSKWEWIYLIIFGFLALLTLMCVFEQPLPSNFIGRKLSSLELDDVISRNSALIDYVYLSPRADFPRKHSIDRITIHSLGNDMTLEEIGNLYSRTDRIASANYGIDSSGHIGLYVEEENASHTSGNRANDNRAVNIVVANDDSGYGWHVSDEALESLSLLMTDICIRNDIKGLEYTGDESGNLTLHSMFRDTTCPGAYLLLRISDLIDTVNGQLQIWSNGQQHNISEMPS